MSKNEMTDEQLIGYCEIHCETPRALFKGSHINRMLELAGHPKGFVQRVPDDQFISVHEEMKELCKLALINTRRSKIRLVVNNEDQNLQANV